MVRKHGLQEEDGAFEAQVPLAPGGGSKSKKKSRVGTTSGGGRISQKQRREEGGRPRQRFQAARSQKTCLDGFQLVKPPTWGFCTAF